MSGIYITGLKSPEDIIKEQSKKYNILIQKEQKHFIISCMIEYGAVVLDYIEPDIQSVKEAKKLVKGE